MAERRPAQSTRFVFSSCATVGFYRAAVVGWAFFQFHGSKVEAFEGIATLFREVREGFAIRIDRCMTACPGNFSAQAVDCSGAMVSVKLFEVPLRGQSHATAEMEKLVWYGIT
jgi:hypothetical protein